MRNALNLTIAIATAVLLCSVAPAGDAPPLKRPVTRFNRQTVKMIQNIMPRMGDLDADSLHKLYLSQTHNRCLPRWSYLYGPRNLVVLWEETHQG